MTIDDHASSHELGKVQMLIRNSSDEGRPAHNAAPKKLTVRLAAAQHAAFPLSGERLRSPGVARVEDSIAVRPHPTLSSGRGLVAISGRRESRKGNVAATALEENPRPQP
jgi:hypothetical protein